MRWETSVESLVAILFVYLFVCSLQGVHDETQRIRALYTKTSVFRQRKASLPLHSADPHSAQVITLSLFNLFTVSVGEVFPTEGDKTHTTLFGG